MTAAVANAAWLAGCLPESARFARGVRHVAAAQSGVLTRILAANHGTAFGRAHGFGSIRTVAEFQRAVPLSTYEALSPWIDRAAAGEARVLTAEPIDVLQPTSGSSGPLKLVPSTITLRREFQRGIRAWIADLFRAHPSLMGGPAYWSVTPSGHVPTLSSGGIRIGFEDDTAYVGGWQASLVRAATVRPTFGPEDRTLDRVRLRTLEALVRAPALRLISIWNPTFLTLLVDAMPVLADALSEALVDDPQARRRLHHALSASTVAGRHQRLWPSLRLVSCWTDGTAAAPARQLAERFPHVAIQGKGLLATEAFVSLPIADQPAPALAVTSHFLEFVPVNGTSGADGPAVLAHALEVGQRYQVVVTTSGGLYRYRLGDVIEVVRRWHECPLVRFVGRDGLVSDWVGEKLNEAHVADVLRAATARLLDQQPSFAMLACETSATPHGYDVFVETDAADVVLQQLVSDIDAGLCANPHYRYARDLGQLRPLEARRVRGGARRYMERCVADGQRAGDVKPVALDRRDGWSTVFAAEDAAAPTPAATRSRTAACT